MDCISLFRLNEIVSYSGAEFEILEFISNNKVMIKARTKWSEPLIVPARTIHKIKS